MLHPTTLEVLLERSEVRTPAPLLPNMIVAPLLQGLAASRDAPPTITSLQKYDATAN